MTLDQFRPHVKGIIDPIVSICIKLGITPNSFTVASLLAALGAGVSFFYQNIIIGTILVFGNAVLDALDGAIARAQNTQSPRGDFLDHAFDRYADIFIITGIFAGGFAAWQLSPEMVAYIGVFALTGVLMASYLGTQAQAVGLGRNYGGVLGRADRLVLLLLAGILDMLIPGGVYGLPYLGWVLIIFGVMGHFTAIQRFMFAWKTMK
ncbi:MAG TPA: CDP-alcohol phosphatidyltransferase family protein [Methanoregulaceae archaeon]|nr:CDP-alcohol phosphatidyltransferase family protein [Methanoregulaceae archaeon]